jgi:acetoin utilization deacetylase AcuC-like enzyme
VNLATSPMIYIHSTASLRHDPLALSPEHPDSPARLVAIEAALDAATLHDLVRYEAPAVRSRDLRRVHSHEHVAFICDLCRSGGGKLDQDTYVRAAASRRAVSDRLLRRDLLSAHFATLGQASDRIVRWRRSGPS